MWQCFPYYGLVAAIVKFCNSDSYITIYKNSIDCAAGEGTMLCSSYYHWVPDATILVKPWDGRH